MRLKLAIIKPGNSDLVACILCLIFVIICLAYSSQISLWGDEAFSMNLAETSWQNIMDTPDPHLPTHAFFLKLIIGFTGAKAKDEIWIRTLHSVIFAVALFIGYQTIKLSTESKALSAQALLASILLPAFVFYATNIRMYALVFLGVMLFTYSVALILKLPHKASPRYWILYLFSATFLLLTDYPSIVFYLIGMLFVAQKTIREKHWLGMSLLWLPLLSYGLYYNRIVQSVALLLVWNQTGANAKAEMAQFVLSPTAIAKIIYLSFRPALDIVNSAAMPVVLSLLISGILAISIGLNSLAFIWQRHKRTPLRRLIVCLALAWLIGIPAGVSITRIFLPCLFFMTAILVVGFLDFKHPLQRYGWVMLSLLVVVNAQQVFHPTLRTSSMIPFEKIASDCFDIATQSKIDTIVLTNNTLNSLVVERYLRQEHKTDTMSILSLSMDADLSTLPKEPFLLVSQKQESDSGGFFDVQQIESHLDRSIENVGNYLNLDDLPFNALWKQYFVGRSSQAYAVSIYRVAR